MPAVYCEVAFRHDSDGHRLWTDISDYVEWEKSVTISRRRQHELDDVQPGTMALSLINTDGRFTAGNTNSPYYPNLTLNRPIRIRARWPGSVNRLLRGQADGSDTSLFDVTSGTITASATAPAGQTSSIRWAADMFVGYWLQLGDKSLSTATDQALPVSEGVTYSVRCQARRETNAITVAVMVRWYDADGDQISDSTGTGVVLTTSFQAVSLSAAAPAGAAYARVVLRSSTTGTGRVVYASAWQFEEAASPTTWVDPGAEHRRFTGFVDRWPHAWTNGVLGTAAITATDRQKLLSRDRVRSALMEEMLGVVPPLFYYPLSEPEDSLQAGNRATTAQPDMLVQLTGGGGGIEFGVKGGPDDSTGVLLTPADTLNGHFLLVPMLTSPLGGVAGISVAAWVNFGETPKAGQNRVIFVDNGSDTMHLRVNYDTSTNSLSIGAKLPAGSVTGSTTSVNLDDNQLHLIVATAQLVGGTMQLRVYVDGATAISTNPGLAGSTWPSLGRVRVGGLPGSALDPPELMEGLISHVIGWNAVITQTQAQAMSDARDGFAGELAGARMARIAGWSGVTSTDFDAGSSLVDKHPSTEQSPLAAFKQVAFTEAGLFFMSGDDVAVLYGRNRRQFPPAASISLTADQCASTLQFTMDDQLLINDVAVSRSGRTVTRVIDQASIDTHQGTYAATIDTLLFSDTEALDRASYTLSTYGHPQPRAGQISVDAHALGTVWDEVLGSEIGQLIEVTDLPAEAPASSLQLWCEGVQDVITDSTWTLVMDTSPVRDAPVFILDDATFGTLDNNYLGW